MAEEFVEEFGGRGEPGEVEGEAADESAAIGGRGRGETELAVAGADERVDVARGFLEGAEGPPSAVVGGDAAVTADVEGGGGFRPRGAGLNPLFEGGDFGVVEPAIGGHLEARVLAADGFDEEAGAGVAGLEGGTEAATG